MERVGSRTYIQKGKKGSRDAENGRYRCKDCRLDCALKKKLLSIDDMSECIVLNAREHAEKFNHPVIDNNILLGLAARTLKVMNNKAKKPLEYTKFFEMLVKFKDAFYPEIQKSAQLNVNVNAAKEIIDAIIDNKN